MTLRERFEGLEDRERRLLGILLLVFVGMIVVLVPVGAAAMLSSKQGENEELRAAVEEIQSNRDTLRKRAVQRERAMARYGRPAPPLAALLDRFAKQVALEIPESQDRTVVPHGKRYDEKATKIVFRRVGMLNLVEFMEKVEQSGHPVSITSLNIRKRGTEVDMYDVEMTVSAFERKAAEAPGTKKKQPAGKEDEQQ
jgi:general secretion pathway protein M